MRVLTFVCLVISSTALAQGSDVCAWVDAELELRAAEQRFGPQHPERTAIAARAAQLSPPATERARIVECAQAKRVELRAARAELATRFGPRHPEMLVVERQLRWLDDVLR